MSLTYKWLQVAGLTSASWLAMLRDHESQGSPASQRTLLRYRTVASLHEGM